LKITAEPYTKSASPAADGYCNPILAYGVERLSTRQLLPGRMVYYSDLPPEEAAALEAACRVSRAPCLPAGTHFHTGTHG
jgi:hypothetical protein